MPSCERYEVEIEQREHGALGGPARDRLALHLASCESCREFATVVQQVRRRLNDRAEASARAVDWARVEKQLTQRSRDTRMARWLYGAVAFLIPVGLLSTGPSPGAFAAAAALELALGATMFAGRGFSRRWLQSFQASSDTSEGLLALYRVELDGRIRGIRLALGSAIVLAIFSLGICFLYWPRGPWGAVRVLVLIACICLGGAAYLWRWELAPTRRARQSCDR